MCGILTLRGQRLNNKNMLKNRFRSAGLTTIPFLQLLRPSQQITAFDQESSVTAQPERKHSAGILHTCLCVDLKK